MKKNVLWIGVCLIMMLTLSCTKKTSEWNLVWEENFDQTDGFDTAVWSKIPRGLSPWNKKMSDFDSLYAIKEGNLILRGIVNTTLHEDTSVYLTGGLYSKGKKTFGFGRLEIRAKLQGARGAWPAIWLLPEDKPWPDGGEIDIMERLNNDSIAYQTVHSYYTHVLDIKDTPQQGGTGLINRDEYNVYAVEMYPDSLSFYINDVHTFTYPRIETDKKGQYPFDKNLFYLLIDMQLGGDWVGEIDPNDLPVEMRVDWVRYYQKKLNAK